VIAFVARRILIAIPTVVLIALAVFSMQMLLPGDPVLAMAPEERDSEVLAYLREKY
jgi:peptide/nickel transport system permease protein